MPEDTNIAQKTNSAEKVTSVRFLTDESQQPEYVRRLAKSAREASRNAIKKLHEQGLPAAYVKNGDLILKYPDGHEEILEKGVCK